MPTITPEQINAILSSSGLTSGLNSQIVAQIKAMASKIKIDPALTKALVNAIAKGDQNAINAALLQIVNSIKAQALPVIAPVIAQYLAGAIVDKLGLDAATSAKVKTALTQVLTLYLQGQTTPNAEALKQQLIAQGLDAKFAEVLAGALAPWLTDQMMQAMAPVVAGLIVDLIGKAIGIPIPSTIKAKIVEKLSPIVLQIMKGITNPSGISGLTSQFSSIKLPTL